MSFHCTPILLVNTFRTLDREDTHLAQTWGTGPDRTKGNSLWDPGSVHGPELQGWTGCDLHNGTGLLWDNFSMLRPEQEA